MLMPFIGMAEACASSGATDIAAAGHFSSTFIMRAWLDHGHVLAGNSPGALFYVVVDLLWRARASPSICMIWQLYILCQTPRAEYITATDAVPLFNYSK